MDNRGKHWSVDDDQKLMESPHLPNTFFSQSMGRSENAIKFRRSHIAVKMHQNDPTAPLEEYVALMWGDLDHANQLLQEWNEKRANFKSFLDMNRKRKAQEQAAPPQEPIVHTSRFFPQARPALEKTDRSFWDDSPDDARIKTICESIREEGGNLASVFNDQQFLPCLVQNYSGFEAYARIVQARLMHQQ